MPSPRTAAGNSLRKDRRRTAERAWMVVESGTPELSHQGLKTLRGWVKNAIGSGTIFRLHRLKLVGTGRFELPTPRTPSECSTRLSHVPTRKDSAATAGCRKGKPSASSGGVHR